MNTQNGKVYLVGAGPGDPKLITVRGMELLQKADVIVYDRLVSPELLEYAPQGTIFIFCGKQPDHHTIPQEKINDILVEHAQLGRQVVRLKGGDPCIFGRVGEEAERCAEQNIAFEIVPGITSGIAAPAYAGIPLTHRQLSSSVAIVTGHQQTAGNEKHLNWEHLATATETLVIYMGVKNLPFIQEQLIKHGRHAHTPVALIRWGTLEKQETLVGNLENIQDIVEQQQFRSPAIIVVGEVVRLRDKLAWFLEEQQLVSP